MKTWHALATRFVQGAANWSLEQATQYLKDCECDLLPGCVRSAAATAAAADIAAAVKAMGLNGGVV